MAKTKDKTEEVKDTSINMLDAYLKKNKKDHLNFEKEVKWRVSTGSLLFDAEQGGGFTAGAYKVAGPSFSGKTHFTLGCIKSGLESIPKSKGLWIIPEGRLDDEVKERVGVKFVYSAEEWDYGTCFVLETNVYEVAFGLINDCVKNNPDENVYLMGIDSIDCLLRRDDVEKGFEDSEKVAAGGTLSSALFKRINGILNKKGHALFILDQIRASPKISKFEKSNPNDHVGKGGANATIHAANQIWYFSSRSKSIDIVEGTTTVGHYCRIGVCKGLKERTDILIEFPIKHGRKGGNSIWKEYEICDLLIQWEMIEKRGSWIYFTEELISELKSAGFEIEDEFKIQGDVKLKDWLEDNPKIVDFFYNKFLKLFTEG